MILCLSLKGSQVAHVLAPRRHIIILFGLLAQAKLVAATVPLLVIAAHIIGVIRGESPIIDHLLRLSLKLIDIVLSLFRHEELGPLDEARLSSLLILLEEIEDFLPLFKLAFIVLLSKAGLGSFLLSPETLDLHVDFSLLVRHVLVLLRLLTPLLPLDVFVRDVADAFWQAHIEVVLDHGVVTVAGVDSVNLVLISRLLVKGSFTFGMR